MYKTLLIGALSIIGFAAHAAEVTPVEHYSYGTQPDIAHVISQTAPDEYKDVSPVQLTYLDSAGVKHVMEYDVVGTGHSG
ncbi:MAG: hypothetical protein JWP80_3924 [Pseudomonas sp.]|nr:hypothetical protein [Pseudomonas sp.]